MRVETLIQDMERDLFMLKEIEETIFNEINEELTPIIYKLAGKFKIAGYDRDDLVQEMRIKLWNIIKNNKYNPDICRPSTFFYRVFYNLIIDLNRLKKDPVDEGLEIFGNFDKELIPPVENVIETYAKKYNMSPNEIRQKMDDYQSHLSLK